jgi:hypothetical protein
MLDLGRATATVPDLPVKAQRRVRKVAIRPLDSTDGWLRMPKATPLVECGKEASAFSGRFGTESAHGEVRKLGFTRRGTRGRGRRVGRAVRWRRLVVARLWIFCLTGRAVRDSVGGGLWVL